MLWGALAGTIPDLDVFLRFFTDDITATYLHRGFSHSFVFSILAALILGWAVHKIHKRGSPTRANWSWMFFWCFVTHSLLDIQTTYGTQFFWPFEARLAIKNIFVLDPFYTLPFLIMAVITMFYKRSSVKRRQWNRRALIVSCSYLFLSFLLKGFGYYKFQQRLDETGLSYIRMDTQPTPLNILLWNAQIETDTGYIAGYYSIFDSEEIRFLDEIPKHHELLDPYRDHRSIQQLLKISDGWYKLEAVDDALIYTDIRFGQIGFEKDSPFVWNYKIKKKPDGSIAVSRYQAPSGNLTLSKALKGLWDRIGGN